MTDLEKAIKKLKEAKLKVDCYWGAVDKESAYKKLVLKYEQALALVLSLVE